MVIAAPASTPTNRDETTRRVAIASVIAVSGGSRLSLADNAAAVAVNLYLNIVLIPRLGLVTLCAPRLIQHTTRPPLRHRKLFLQMLDG